MQTKTLWIREEYLQQILDRLKTIEIRVGYNHITRLQIGDVLLLHDAHAFTITRNARNANFKELLAHEDASKFAPDVSPEKIRDVLRVADAADAHS